jgi:hypothetical protein
VTVELGKLFQNIEIRVRGRTAIVVCGTFVLAFGLWVILKDYALHPLFSDVAGGSSLAAICLLLGVGLLGGPRPEEVPPKSFLTVNKVGVVVAHGIGSHADLMDVIREISGIRKLPLPSAITTGAAADESSYKALTPDQANAILAETEKGIQDLISAAAEGMVAISQPQLEGVSEETATVKGKSKLT